MILAHLSKNDLDTADRVINGQFGTLDQWNRDVDRAKALGLVEFEIDVDGGRYVASHRYVELLDKLEGSHNG